MEKKLDTNRMIELISGKRTPETIEETILIEYYVEALSGHSLAELVMSNSEHKFEQFSTEGLRMIIYGYSVGQRHYDERVEQFQTDNLIPSTDENTH